MTLFGLRLGFVSLVIVIVIYKLREHSNVTYSVNYSRKFELRMLRRVKCDSKMNNVSNGAKVSQYPAKHWRAGAPDA